MSATGGLMGESQAYKQVYGVDEEKARKKAKNLVKGYTMWFDEVLARGIMGWIYAIWTVGVLIYNVLQFTEVTTGPFLVTVILTTIELGVVVLFSVILIWLSYRAYRNIKDMRKLAKSNVSIAGPAFNNGIRSRGNIVSDFNLLGSVLFAIIIEAVIVWVFYGGNNVRTNFLSWSNSAVAFPLTTVDLGDVQNYVMVKAVFLYLIIKAVVVLGFALNRTMAIIVSTRLEIASQEMDRSQGADTRFDGPQLVKLAVDHGTGPVLGD